MLSTAGLARVSARRPWVVVAAWLVVLVLAVVAASGLGDALTSEGTFSNRPESVRGDELVEERLRPGQEHPVNETVVVRSETATVDDLAFREAVERTAAELRAIPDVVASVTTYYEADAAGSPVVDGLVSADRHTALIPVTLAGDFDAATENIDAYLGVVEGQDGDDIRVLTVGDVSITEEFNVIAEQDLVKGEGLGLLASLVVLVIVFGALVTAGVPLALAIVSIIVAVGLTALLGRVMDLSFFIVNMITMIGLAAGIDYALFIVERYREERRNGRPKHQAIEIAGGTASKAVLFSGSTVVLALLGMFLIPTVVFRSLGAGAVLVVIVAVLASLTLVPAMLSLLGDKIDWPRKRKYDVASAAKHAQATHETIHAGFWGRITRVVMARPIISVVFAAGLLLAAAVPYLDMNRGQAGVESLPESNVRTAFEYLSADFPAGMLALVEVVVDGPRTAEVQAGIDRLFAATGQDPVFAAAGPAEWNAAGDLALVSIPLTVDASAPAALEAVATLRDDMIPAAFEDVPADVLVSGAPAGNADLEEVILEYTPIVFAFVLGLSFLLLMLAFRSIVVPLKAIVMNLLSVGSAYGLLVLVFQKGYGADLLGFQQTPTIEAWLPIFLFCVLFGLSMDYHVFLLSRVREHYDLTKRNRESVAVLIDATLVRTVLVPASMALLGHRNWYLPRWLSWLPDLGVEGSPVPANPAHPAPLAQPAHGAGYAVEPSAAD